MPGRAATWAVVVAGGSGSRFGSYKQFALLAGRPAWLIVRPEHLSVAPGPLSNRLDAVVDDLVYAGAATICRLRVGGATLSMQIPGDATAFTLGARVSVGWNAADSVVLHDP